MAKTRAQKKAERRKREQQGRQQVEQARDTESQAQHATQVPESADVIEAELIERAGATPEELIKQTDVLGQALPAPAPSRDDSAREERRRQKAEEKERRTQEREKEKKKGQAKRKAPARKAAEVADVRQHGAVISFLLSSWAELKRVQWPDRETLVQATAVTIIFISIAGAYLGALDALFNWLIKRIL